MNRLIYSIFFICFLSLQNSWGQGEATDSAPAPKAAEGEAAATATATATTVCPCREIPQLGMGTYLDSMATDVKRIGESVLMALRLGYRHFDGASRYYNQDAVGAALKRFLEEQDAVKRENLWLTSKYPGVPVHKKNLQKNVQKTLVELNTSYLDLLLIHFPEADLTKAQVVQAWKNMSELVHGGQVRHIGVSNFYREHLDVILEACDKDPFLVRPYINQIEVNPVSPESEFVKYCQERGVRVAGYAPLGGAAYRMIFQASDEDSPLSRNLRVIAREVSSKRGEEVSAEQLVLAWILKRGIITIPKSLSERHLRTNLKAQELAAELDEATMAGIQAIFGLEGIPTVDTAQEAKYSTRFSE